MQNDEMVETDIYDEMVDWLEHQVVIEQVDDMVETVSYVDEKVLIVIDEVEARVHEKVDVQLITCID